jgi:dimethylargininase
MKKFQSAIVRTPSYDLPLGISTSGLGEVNYKKALQQHSAYIEALKACGLDVILLGMLPGYPDSTFVEDVAVVSGNLAIITRPGATSRRGEVEGIKEPITSRFTHTAIIEPPGTLEGGDVMTVDNHYYIGLSSRTNREGAQQLISILQENGKTGSMVDPGDLLHLKTGVSYIEQNTLLCVEELSGHVAFERFDKIIVPPSEAYAANAVWINGMVLLPAGFQATKNLLDSGGYEVLEVDVSEFRKLDGGLSCLSIRY